MAVSAALVRAEDAFWNACTQPRSEAAELADLDLLGPNGFRDSVRKDSAQSTPDYSSPRSAPMAAEPPCEPDRASGERRDGSAPGGMETGETARGSPETSAAGSRCVGKFGAINHRMPRVVGASRSGIREHSVAGTSMERTRSESCTRHCYRRRGWTLARGSQGWPRAAFGKRFLEDDCWMVFIDRASATCLLSSARCADCLTPQRHVRRTLGL